MNTLFGPSILDIDTMMKKFMVDDPFQLLDMFEGARNYLPTELRNLKQAIERDAPLLIFDSVHSLKGALGYLSAPKSEDVILKWNDFLCHEKPSKETLNVMFHEIESAVTQLCDAIDEAIGHIQNTNI